MGEKRYTTFDIAKLCGVYTTTVINWIKQGKLKAYSTPGGHRRVVESDLKDFLERFKLPVTLGTEDKTRRRVLIIEDDEDVGRLLRRVLEGSGAGLEVEWIKEGIQGLLALGKEPPELVILDVVMPVVDGARILATLRLDPHTAHIKVIGITGKRLAPEKLRFMTRRCDAFLFKPFDIEEFVRTALGLLKGTPAPLPQKRARPRS